MRAELLIWGSLAVLLVAAEMLVPGAFMLWLGVAAGAVFLLLLIVPLTPLWQVVAFVGLAFALVGLARRLVRRLPVASDQPLLNRRAEQFVGQHFELHSPIVGGRGRIQVGNALWTVTGPDLPLGARVLVIAADSMTLVVAPEPKP